MGGYDFVYPAGLGSYVAGTKVLASDGGIYQCSVAGWCNLGGAYEPGKGWAADNAWTKVGSGTAPSVSPSVAPSVMPSVTPSVTPSVEPSVTPSVPPSGNTTWDSAKVYNGGDQVLLNGVKYQAKWWTQGDNPAQSGDWGVWKKV